MNNDELLMKRALELALKGSGQVNPNPRVGAVLVKDGEIISEGWHKEYGKPHAEIEAINSAPESELEGSVLYVNLEPCNHTGKTPPCTDAIIEKKISKVVIGMSDPNTKVEGGGAKRLREAGIEVVEGVLEDESRWINRFFIKHITTGLPYVILKTGQTIDGNIATAHGESKWITGEESRRRGHILRASVDAILVGNQTVSSDDPSLTTRYVEGHCPKRLILDTQLSLPLTLKVLSDFDRCNTYVFCSEAAASSRKAGVLSVAGVNLVPCILDESDKLEINDVVSKIGNSLGMSALLVEGGAKVFSSFAQSGLVDELHTFIAPKLFGQGYHSFRALSVNSIDSAPSFEIKAISQSGSDIHIVSVRKNSE